MGRLYLAIAFTLAGTSVIAARFATAYIPPFATTFLSLVFASATAIIFFGKKMYGAVNRLSKKTWTVIALQSIFGSFLFRIFLTIGRRHIGTIEAGIITGATPAITALLTWIMLREHLSLHAIAGVSLTFIGILLVQGSPFEAALGSLQPLGAVMVLCSAACESLFTTLTRKLHMGAKDEEPLPPAVHAGLVSVFAMPLSLVPALAERPWAAIAELPPIGWIALIWYGSIATVVAFAFMFAGAKRCDGYTIAAFAGIIPITSTVLSVVLLQEPIGGYQIAGCALVVLAVLVISRQKKTA
jgi:drug/metabolite transporter (DMT)-like permease